jgi:signal transduction histidine kinase
MLRQLGLAAAGALAIVAWRNGLWANLVILILVGGWLAVETVVRAAPARRLAPGADVAAELRAQRPWRAMLDQTPAPLVTLQADGALRAVNRAARALFQTDDRLAAPSVELVSALKGAGLKARSLILATPTGPRAFALEAADIVGDAGAVRLGVLIDIHSEIQAAEAKALRELLAVLSHEVMNSLTPVASLAETAAECLEGETSESALAARDALALLGRRASGLARFVEGYRTLARLPPPVRRRTNLAALLTDVAGVFEGGWSTRGVRLVFEPPAEDAIVDLDPDLVVQAVLNLLTNAADAALETSPAPEVRLRTEIKAGRVEIMVEDNGPGVPENLRETIFQPFVTTKPSGAGIGLNLARQIALSHGGDLTLWSQVPGQGARFSLAV